MSMRESSRYSHQQKRMTAFSLAARLNLGANSTLALSLPQSFVAAKRRQKPAPSSEGAEAAPPHATDFPRRKKCSNRFRVTAFPCRRYNPSVFSACKTSRKSSSPYTGEPRSALSSPCVAQGSRDLRSRRLGAQTALTVLSAVLKIKKVSTGACSNEKGACSNGKRADTHKRVPAWALLSV